MKRGVRAAGVAALVGLAAMLAPAGAQGTKAPTVKEIMKRGHGGPSSLLTELGRALKSDAPDWPGVRKRTGQLVELGTALGKNAPPTGGKSSWDRLTAAYLDNVKAFDAAAAKQDRAGARTVKAKIDASCVDCHKAHRKQDD